VKSGEKHLNPNTVAWVPFLLCLTLVRSVIENQTSRENFPLERKDRMVSYLQAAGCQQRLCELWSLNKYYVGNSEVSKIRPISCIHKTKNNVRHNICLMN
jgi:hypothetical protein